MVPSPKNDAAANRVGSVLKDKWQLDALLGIGGMAWVYAATHRNKNRVAIKLLFPEFSGNSEVRRRFLREGYAANSIGHPGAVTVFDDDVTDDGLAFLVMELLEGKTLADLRRERKGRLDPKTVLGNMVGVLDVLATAHEKGVIHRDIKPGNIFVTNDRGVKVVDFGIARVREGRLDAELTRSGDLLGSAAFMAPEQARGRWDEVDARTDLFAVGATMYQLLVGRPVHPGDTPQDRLISAATEPARSIGSVLPSLPRSVVEVVDRALEFDKTRRWQHAREMQAAVEQALKRIDVLGSTLVMQDGPAPLLSSPEAAEPPAAPAVASAPVPRAVAAASPAPPPTAAPMARSAASNLGATRVYGSPEDAAAVARAQAELGRRLQAQPPPEAQGRHAPVPPSAEAPEPVLTAFPARAPPPASPGPAPGAAPPVSVGSQPRRPRRGLLVAVVVVVFGGGVLLLLAAVGLWYAEQRGFKLPGAS
ncbi:MAG: serine/threonine protein kinase [Myxococcales bacterium]|nr:serine/threonine protein kinase [Myxococcales bacterium]